MNKFTTFASALIVGFSSAAFSGNPPAAPNVYNQGPTSPLVSSTNMAVSERIAFALMEAAMSVAEAKIHATSCTSTVGSYPLSVASDTNFDVYTLGITSLGGSYALVATPQAIEPAPGGQKIDIVDTGPGQFDGTPVAEFTGRAIYNTESNILFQRGAVSALGNNGDLDRYQSRVIKDFYQGDLRGSNDYEIFDWGLQVLHKKGYPVNKYWQRSKAHRSDGSNGRTVFVKDRLVGSSRCRITIDVSGTNDGFEFLAQSGNLIVEKVTPPSFVSEFAEAPFAP